MDQSDEMKKEVQYLQKRLTLASQENELLRKENQSMRKELSGLKETFTNIISTKRVQTAGPGSQSQNTLYNKFQNEDAFRQILEMQRQKLNQLEIEHENLKKKYEKLLFQSNDASKNSIPYSKRLTDEYANDSPVVYELKMKISTYEQQLKEMAANHAKEIANLKQKIFQQDAEMILNKSMDSSFNNQNNYQQRSFLQKTPSISQSQNQQKYLKSISLNKKELI